MLKKLLIVLAMLPAMAMAAEGGVALDHAPDLTNDMAALQRGAKIFTNYCLNCHSAEGMRYNRLQDIGLTDKQIKDNLMFASDKVGSLMQVAMDPHDAKKWFGATPPDLTVIARSRASERGSGADYLYTYLRTFYRDPTRPTGWNNLVFPKVGMPNPLWQLQGQRLAEFKKVKDPHEDGEIVEQFEGYKRLTQGTMTEPQFDQAIADLTSYLVYMGEPARHLRIRLGVIVVLFFGLFTFFAWRLNASYWKDID